jgi:hypothetical protein
VLAALPVVLSVAARLVTWPGKSLAVPSAALLAGLVLLFIGGQALRERLAGHGRSSVGGPGIVPAGVAAFSRASTLWVSSYWAHPSALARFPAAEVAWMVVCPVALACVAGGAAALVRRTELSRRAARFEARLGSAACLVMAVFLAGCCPWVLVAGTARGLFHAGVIDAAALAVMTAALAAACQAAAHARHGLARR